MPPVDGAVARTLMKHRRAPRARGMREGKDESNRPGFSIPVPVNISRIDMLTSKLKSIFQDILDSDHLTVRNMILRSRSRLIPSAPTG